MKSSQTNLARSPNGKAEFIEPMECALVSRLPEGGDWTYEVKLDGYRAVGVRTSGETILYSRNGKNFNKRFPQIVEALRNLPVDAVIDGEVVALDNSGRPGFSSASTLHCRSFTHSLPYLRSHYLERTRSDQSAIEPMTRTYEDIQAALAAYSPLREFHISADDMFAAVCKQQLEGVIGRLSDSFYVITTRDS